ncbi:MAG: C2 family cysteine protease [Vulcanimicrobiota bacterium]
MFDFGSVQPRSSTSSFSLEFRANSDVLVQGVASGLINRNQFVALDLYHQQAGLLAQQLRAGGYSPIEAAYLDQRMQQWRMLAGQFMMGDYQGGPLMGPGATRSSFQYDEMQTGLARSNDLQGVRSGMINRSEFQYLDAFSGETQRLRALFREGGYSPQEAAFLDQRYRQYQGLRNQFMVGDYQPELATSDETSMQNYLRAGQIFDGVRNGQINQRQAIEGLRQNDKAAYGEAVLDQHGMVYEEEREAVRRYHSQGDFRPGQGPAQEPTQADANLSQALSSRLDKWDLDHDGRVSRQEMDRVLSEPGNRGTEAELAAVALNAFEELAGLNNEGGGPGLSRADLQAYEAGPRGAGDQQWTTAHKRMQSGWQRTRQRAGAEERLFQGRPDPNSISQGLAGDCWVLSAMSRLTPDQIERMLTPLKGGGYQVTFPDGNTQVVAGLTEAERGIYATSNGDWAALLEKAAAQRSQQMGQEISEGGPAAAGIELFTGHRAMTVSMHGLGAHGNHYNLNSNIDGRDPAVVGDILEATLAEGKMVTAGVLNNDANGNQMVTSHAYAVMAYDPVTQMVTVRNPWGRDPADHDGSNDGLVQMPLSEFQASFSTLAFEAG